MKKKVSKKEKKSPTENKEIKRKYEFKEEKLKKKMVYSTLLGILVGIVGCLILTGGYKLYTKVTGENVTKNASSCGANGIYTYNRCHNVQSPTVSWLQTKLYYYNCLPYSTDYKDGYFGPKTKAAVVAFQKANGLEADGNIGPITHKALNAKDSNSCSLSGSSSSTSSTSSTSNESSNKKSSCIKNNAYTMSSCSGKYDKDVKDFQDILVAAGCLAKTDADGKFGPRTKAAVIAFQKINGLEADGSVGPITMGKIYATHSVCVHTSTGDSSSSKSSSSSSSSKSSSGKYYISSSDYKTLVITVCGEDDSSYEGAKAVMDLILNRVDAKGYPNTIMGVISAHRQFEAYYSSTVYNKRKAEYNKGGCGYARDAVRNALANPSVRSNKCYSFRDAKSGDNSYVIGDNKYYNCK